MTLDDLFEIYYDDEHTVRTVELLQNTTPEEIVNVIFDHNPPPPPPDIPEQEANINALLLRIADVDLSLILRIIKAGLISRHCMELFFDNDNKIRNRIPIALALATSDRNYQLPLQLLDLIELIVIKKAGYQVPIQSLCNELTHIQDYENFIQRLYALAENEIDLSERIDNLELPIWFYTGYHGEYDYDEVGTTWDSLTKSHDINEAEMFVLLVKLGLNARGRTIEWKHQFVHDFVGRNLIPDRFIRQDWDLALMSLLDAGIVPKLSDLDPQGDNDYRLKPDVEDEFEDLIERLNSSLSNICLAKIIEYDIDISKIPDKLKHFQLS